MRFPPGQTLHYLILQGLSCRLENLLEERDTQNPWDRSMIDFLRGNGPQKLMGPPLNGKSSGGQICTVVHLRAVGPHPHPRLRNLESISMASLWMGS